MISRSRAGRSARRASRDASAGFQSGMFGPRDLLNGVHEFAPVVPLRRQDLPALASEAIEAAPALAGLLDPLAHDPAPLLEPVEQGIQGRDLELHPPAGARLDQLADLVPMPGPGLHEGQDQQLRAAFLELPVEHAGYMLHS